MCVCIRYLYAFLAAKVTCCRSLPPSPSTMFPLSSDTDLILSSEACGSAKEVVRSLDWSCSTYFKNSCRLVLRRRLAISINSSWCWLALIDALFVLLLLMLMMLMLLLMMLLFLMLMIRLFNACVSKDFFFGGFFADTHSLNDEREQNNHHRRDGRGRNLVSKVSR